MDPDTTRFNRRFEIAALVYMLVVLPTSLVLAPEGRDFGQYYMGGLVGIDGSWDDLYPDSTRHFVNPGFRYGSEMRPRYRELAEASGVGDENRFIQPPPMVLPLMPLALLPLSWALGVWVAIMIVCVFAAALESARLLERLVGRPTRLRGPFVLIVCASPLVWDAIRLGQLTPVAAWFVAMTLTGLIDARTPATAAGVVGSSLTKQFGIFHLPLVVILGRWRAVVWMGAATVVVLAASLAVMGTGPFEAWITRVAPFLSRSALWNGNQSFEGLALRWIGAGMLPQGPRLALRATGLCVFVGLVWLAWRRRHELADDASLLTAAFGSLTIAGLIFSPLAWMHYYLYLLPMWAWLGAEALERPRLRIPAALIVLSMWVPLCVYRQGTLLPGEPWVSHMLWGATALLALAVARLVSAPR